ncbi:hypothetical protein GCM10009119_41040 [Algoriphagus jejuensis]|uniref:Uncharacterized protein n=1 Tax=Algoriphagus jejuensis TaxID=419934 RepID=A0ABN1N599_9BACT
MKKNDGVVMVKILSPIDLLKYFALRDLFGKKNHGNLWEETLNAQLMEKQENGKEKNPASEEAGSYFPAQDLYKSQFALFPLDRSRWLGRDIVHDAIHPFDAVDDLVGNFA